MFAEPSKEPTQDLRGVFEVFAELDLSLVIVRALGISGSVT